MPAVTIGARNIRGTIQGPTKAKNPSGQIVKTYAAIATDPIEFVAVLPLRGAELLRAQQAFGETPARFRFRFRDDLTAEMRFVTDEGASWEFKSPPADPDGRRREIEVMAVQRA